MLSIIIPTFNEEGYLPILLGSLKKQTFKDFEVIVADNNSSDRTRIIAKKFGAKVVKGGMPAVGRNNGAKGAKGDWLLFLDADVVLPFDFLDKAMREIKNKNLSVASCLVTPLSDKKIDKFLHGVANLSFKVSERFSPHAPGFCIFIKTKVHKLLNGFDERLKLREDHDYVRRGSCLGKFGLLKLIRISVSVRRLEKDGRFNILFKYILVELHSLFLGPIYSDVFNYKFGGYSKRK